MFLVFSFLMYVSKAWILNFKKHSQVNDIQALELDQKKLHFISHMTTWSKSEDILLLRNIATYGFKWNLISSNTPGKTLTQCYSHYYVLRNKKDLDAESQLIIKEIDKSQKPHIVPKRKKAPYKPQIAPPIPQTAPISTFNESWSNLDHCTYT